MTTRDLILPRLATIAAGLDTFPNDVPIDESEPSRWATLPADPQTGVRLQHAAGVPDGPPAEETARLSGPEGEPLYEFELDAAVVYVVQSVAVPGSSPATLRAVRRARRALAVTEFASAIAADPTLGLGDEVYAMVRPIEPFDDVLVEGGVPASSAVIPVLVLYTSASAAG